MPLTIPKMRLHFSSSATGPDLSHGDEASLPSPAVPHFHLGARGKILALRRAAAPRARSLGVVSPHGNFIKSEINVLLYKRPREY